MEIEKLDRVVIAVPDVNEAARFFKLTLGIDFNAAIEFPEAGAKVMFSRYGMELVQPTSSHSALNEIVKRRPGLYAISFKVKNLDSATKELQERGIRTIASSVLADGRFEDRLLHPKDTMGIQIVLSSYDEEHPAYVILKDR